ncbi:MAG TPA: YciI family protein [Longimicrobiales bacterium]|jgi:hypothetical protein|nr:YciI family protein [Longimicrobiales bacterium]
MRFIVLVKANESSEAGELPREELIAEMASYHEELARAGALLDASGLHPSSRGWRVHYSGEERRVVDGPFTEAKELVAGYTIIEAGAEAEAREWVRRFPNPGGPGGEAEIEVRRLFDLDDFEQGPAVDRFRELSLPSQP